MYRETSHKSRPANSFVLNAHLADYDQMCFCGTSHQSGLLVTAALAHACVSSPSRTSPVLSESWWKWRPRLWLVWDFPSIQNSPLMRFLFMVSVCHRRLGLCACGIRLYLQSSSAEVNFANSSHLQSVACSNSMKIIQTVSGKAGVGAKL